MVSAQHKKSCKAYNAHSWRYKLPRDISSLMRSIYGVGHKMTSLIIKATYGVNTAISGNRHVFQSMAVPSICIMMKRTRQYRLPWTGLLQRMNIFHRGNHTPCLAGISRTNSMVEGEQRAGVAGWKGFREWMYPACCFLQVDS